MLELTPEQINEERETRLKAFRDELKALSEKYSMNLKPQISPDGPVINIIDFKYENKTPII